MHTTLDVIEAIRAHGEATYPEECCGLLLGRFNFEADHIDVAATLPVENEHPDGRERRFTITPEVYFAAEREASRRDLDVVGVYHSHPDHPARPSETDLAEATYPGVMYVIVAVHKGVSGPPTAWSLAPDRSRFLHQHIRSESTQP